MAGGFEELERITADLGVRAWGPSLQEAFKNTASALFNLISDTNTLSGETSRAFYIKADDTPGLLVNFLNEIIFLEDTEGFLPKSLVISDLGPSKLRAAVSGDIYDNSRHQLKDQIKAATYHGLRIEEKSDGYVIEVIFDV